MSTQTDSLDPAGVAAPASAERQDAARDDIAIVGMACRFPGARDYDDFWQSMRDGVFNVKEVPQDRWSIDKYYSTNREDENKTVSKWGGFIDDIDKFDAPLFRISPREAELMDPQQRIMLELAWSCIEDAGYAPSDFRGTETGVYIGCCNFDYKVMVERSLPSVEAHISTGVHTTLIPNRISYEFDLRGPSVPIDTACSSSLVALEEAVNALRRGDCSAALVGGVSILLSPTHFISFSKAGMLSPQGICRSFDERADGYVRGEGAGIILLKPLRQALRDNDRIYGLVKGVAVNHGGKVSTITSPNPFAQSKAVDKAFKDAGVSPASVNYIEAHGTGTPKGDPIEMNALIRAYASMAKTRGIALPERSCAIGSIKTNIGHLEASAGIAGIIKVLLAMKHRSLPKLLHFEKLNPRIKIEGSPFYFVTERQPWEAGTDGVRRAGVSSFGFGGVNAHILLEDYAEADASGAPAAAEPAVLQPLLFVISAKTGDSLARYAQRLVEYLDAAVAPASGRPLSLESLAYSLQKREQMEERVAFEALTAGELEQKLQKWLEGAKVEGCWRASTKEGRDVADLMSSGDEMASILKSWLFERNSARLGELWVKGIPIPDWDLYYSSTPAGKPPRKLRLPVYQFARKRYWFEDGRMTDVDAEASAATVTDAAVRVHLHPLVQENTSTLAEQRFSAVLTGDEFFLKDHQVNGDKVLPGVAYLEMAQAAMRRATGAANQASGAGVQLKNVVWARPVVVRDAPFELHIGLYPDPAAGQDDGFVSYEVYSGHREDEVTIHSQGKIRFLEAGRTPAVDLPQLRARLKDGARSVDNLYALFAGMGIHYGAAHRGVESVWAGRGCDADAEVLARVAVPSAVAATKTHFVLHPSLLDSALQACLAIGSEAFAPGMPPASLRPLVPFALSSVEVWEPAFDVEKAPAALWAWARPAQDRSASAASAPAQSFEARMAVPFDIDLCDDAGRVYIAIRGLSFRAAGGQSRSDATELLMLKPEWKEDASGAAGGQAAVYTAHRVLFAGFGDEDAAYASKAIAQLQTMGPVDGGSPILFQDLDAAEGMAPHAGDASFALRFQIRALALFEIVRNMMRDASGSSGRQLLQVVVPAEGRGQLHAALTGLLKTARLENPKLVAQVVVLGLHTPAERLFEHLAHGARHAEQSMFRYEGGRSWIGELSEVKGASPDVRDVAGDGPWKEGGVYLITGGAGGLGRIFAREICERLQRTTLVLTGRSAPGDEASAALECMKRDGVTIEYRRLDVCDRKAVAGLVDDVRQRHGALNGVIHCAGVVRDNYIAKKDREEFTSVLAPKIDGTVHLDEATGDIPLDLFVMFSSTAGALGNAGQADYATANAFMDAFARYRNALCAAGEGGRPCRSGRTVSINWPLWQDGGMHVDAATEQMLKDRMGMAALRTASGIRAFYLALASNEPQVMVMEGHPARMRSKLLSTPAPMQVSQRPSGADAVPVHTGEALDKIQATLLEMAAKLLKLSPDDLDTRTQLSEYGFDSIAYTGLANRIGEKYGIELSPAVFFDYPTVEGIAKYLWQEHRDNVAGPVQVVQPAPEAQPSVEVPVAEDIEYEEPIGSLYRRRMLPADHGRAVEQVPSAYMSRREGSPAGTSEPIAIVGVSGSFPMAPDLAAFWSNLDQGNDCISEIPKQRWDWEAIYADPAEKSNSSNVKWGGFVEGVDEFDPLFFGISPREALLMDPQQRLLMMHVWKVIEDAGYSASSLSGSNTGIFVGTASTGYDSLIAKSNIAIEGFSATGVVPSVGPNRMSFLLNLHGPSEPIETACSSSLVAIHRAILAIEAGDCDQAIVGGVNTIVAPDLHISFNKAGMLALDGRCKTFSKDANGYVRGEGVGMLFLKKLKAAEEAGDHIYGVIRGSAENHGGRSNSLTSPNSKAQADVLVKAYRRAGIDARTVTYLEAHGTGTALGDPIEINGIKTAFKTLQESAAGDVAFQPRCALGSVKTNIGHLELAAGVAGVMKVLLQFRHRRIAASLHCKETNPHIDLSGTRFYIARQSEDWTALRDADGKEIPRRAGVSSFGFGGANAHVVLEEYVAPQTQRVDASRGPVLVPLSAKNAAALRRYAESLIRFLGETPAVSLGDLAYTLQVGREAMDERLGLVVGSVQELQDKLRGFLDGREDVEDLYLGQVGRNRDTLAAYVNDEDLQATMEVWIGKGKYGKFFGMWAKGLSFDWHRLYQDGRSGRGMPRRISMPTYPFARERFWPGTMPSRTPLPAATPSGSRHGAAGSLPAQVQPDDVVLKTLAALGRGAVSIDDAIAAVSGK